MRNAIRGMAAVAALVCAFLFLSFMTIGASHQQLSLLDAQPVPIEVIFQQGVDGYTQCEDTYIEHATGNHCLKDHFLVRGRDYTSALIRFDVSSIPNSATIVEAYLETYADVTSSPLELEVGAFGVLKDWAACEATWELASGVIAWQQPGAMGVEDRAVIAVDSEIIVGPGWCYHNVTKLVQNWVLGASSNKGVILSGEDPRYSALLQFASAQHPSVELHPRLRVKYIVTGQVPTPVPPPPVLPTTVITLQQTLDGYTGSEDTYIDASAPNVNNEGGQLFLVRGRTNTSGLIRFDIPALPRDVKVLKAYLQVYASEQSSPSHLQVASHRVLRPWKASEATWLNATASALWEEAGCTGATDRAVPPSDRGMLHGPGWFQFNVTEIVQQWLDSPGSNNGFLLEGYDERWSAAYRFISTDHPSSHRYPRLIVTYAGPPVPTLYRLYLPIISKRT